ncbi:hypothetical protein GIB67_029391 [Kingdonia uniflora]|uniref:Uncharacterized protein n=1 Tax=Kingdonia uniflora TaxID=39325 RepID=A0A7J7NY18_9MAGN|nr:hypothetical protein GIB67_029391 [Kingdonia uniflora]
MKFIAAYLLTILGGNNAPTAEDIKRILGSVKAETDNDKIELLLSQVKGKCITKLIASGSAKGNGVYQFGGKWVIIHSKGKDVLVGWASRDLAERRRRFAIFYSLSSVEAVLVRSSVT